MCDRSGTSAKPRHGVGACEARLQRECNATVTQPGQKDEHILENDFNATPDDLDPQDSIRRRIIASTTPQIESMTGNRPHVRAGLDNDQAPIKSNHSRHFEYMCARRLIDADA